MPSAWRQGLLSPYSDSNVGSEREIVGWQTLNRFTGKTSIVTSILYGYVDLILGLKVPSTIRDRAIVLCMNIDGIWHIVYRQFRARLDPSERARKSIRNIRSFPTLLPRCFGWAHHDSMRQWPTAAFWPTEYLLQHAQWRNHWIWCRQYRISYFTIVHQYFICCQHCDLWI